MTQTAHTTAFDSLKGWKLLEGPHSSPYGGGCFNEMAIVAAGYLYRRVSSYKDMPPSFCPVISTFTMALNDVWDDATRQRLVPFITRVAGIAGGPAIEARRAAILLGNSPFVGTGRCPCSMCASLPSEAPDRKANQAAGNLYQFPDRALAVLEEALAIGPQADPSVGYLMAERVEKAQKEVPFSTGRPTNWIDEVFSVLGQAGGGDSPSMTVAGGSAGVGGGGYVYLQNAASKSGYCVGPHWDLAKLPPAGLEKAQVVDA